MTINSYPSVYAIGHKAIENLFDGPVVISEKIDGSQFSLGLIDGELQCRSHGKQLILDSPEKMFTKAVTTAKELESLLHPGWIYRTEYVSGLKHNTLRYDRVPAKNLIVFDIMTGIESYLSPLEVSAECDRIGLECVPIFFTGMVTDKGMFDKMLETTSCLGGTKIEGVVVKNYNLITLEKKVAMGKYVSEKFKEKHATDWKVRNPGQKDVIQGIIDQYHTEARWRKAIQHLKEEGLLEGSPRDIGLLVREIPADIIKEDKEDIMDILWKHFWQQIQRGVIAGMAQWYKEELLTSAFSKEKIDGI